MDDFIQSIVREAGKDILPLFGKERVQYQKSESRGDAVTKADLRAEEILIDHIQKKYPQHGIYSEERGSMNAEAEYLWIMDPIDGTLNFASGVPDWGVMVALAHRREVVLSAIYLPVTDELAFAKRGAGAYINGQPAHCSEVAELGAAVGCIPTRDSEAMAFLRVFIEAVDGTHAMWRSLQCLAQSSKLVAAGHADWDLTFTAKMYDYAPTSLLMEEAGCVVTGVDGKPWRLDSHGMLAANSKLYPTLWQLLERSRT